MTPAIMTELTDLNREVNVLPYTDVQGHGEPFDWWTDIPVPGDSFVCRDYVLMKAQRLRVAGWNPSDLQVVLCWTEPTDYGYHAVLAVTVAHAAAQGMVIEKWILDSRADDPYLMQTPSPNGYTWDRIQVAGTTEFEPVA